MSRLFAKWYDLFMGPLEKRKFQKIRKELVKKASGKVLELGAGTGINFRYYNGVETVIAIEPSEFMIQQAQAKLKESTVPIEIVQAGAEELPFQTDYFDTVVATLVFCTIPNVEKAMIEMRRVCKPNGKILLFEHVKMENPYLAKLQDWLTPAWKKVCDGCCLNRETLAVIESNNISITKIEEYYKGLFFSAEGINKKDK